MQRLSEIQLERVFNTWEKSALHRSEWRKAVRDGYICSRLSDMDEKSSNVNYVKDVLIIYQVALQDGYAKYVEEYFFPKLVT